MPRVSSRRLCAWLSSHGQGVLRGRLYRSHCMRRFARPNVRLDDSLCSSYGVPQERPGTRAPENCRAQRTMGRSIRTAREERSQPTKIVKTALAG